MEVFQSKKRIDGFSTCFRQFAAEDTHCKFLHGYSIYFDVTFEGTLDKRNWVQDFGFMKRSKATMTAAVSKGPSLLYKEFTPDAWFKFMFDHTVVLSMSDPALVRFIELHERDHIQLRIIDKVGCEMFAKLVFDKLGRLVEEESEGRVHVIEVECFEHAKNSAIYKTVMSKTK